MLRILLYLRILIAFIPTGLIGLFVYGFIKKNYQMILSNPNNLDIDRYKNHFSEENFPKVKKLILEYYSKYKNYL